MRLAHMSDGTCSDGAAKLFLVVNNLGERACADQKICLLILLKRTLYVF